MTRQEGQQRVKALNDSTWFQVLGRLFQLIGTPVIVGLLLWGLGKQDKMSDEISTLKSQMTTVTNDPYHGQDAVRDFKYRDLQISINKSDIFDLRGRVSALEIGSARRAP